LGNVRSGREAKSTREPVVLYSARHAVVERLDLSAAGLLVAVCGRLGQRLGTPPERAEAPVPVPPAERRPAGRWSAGLAWLYLSVTLLPTLAVIPASWLDTAPGWRLVVASVGPLLVLGLTLAYLRAAPALGARRVTGTRERAVLCAAHEAVTELRAARPRLGGLAAQLQPAVLDRMLWDLAGVLAERDRVRVAEQQVRAVLDQLPRDEPMAAGLGQRRERLAELRQALDECTARRLACLTAAADTCRGLVADQEIAARAAAATQAADAVLGSSEPPDDGGTDLAERLAAVLDAYRQLQRR
jgi:hypothetical protein